MNENNNGRGLFYGVIGVATLIVAIIGATFAYFSVNASITNNNNMSNSSKVNKMISSVDRKFCLFFNGNSIIKYN